MSEKQDSKETAEKNAPTKEKKEKKTKKKGNSNLKIMEWRFNQFLGEKLTYQQIKEDPENESFLVTDIPKRSYFKLLSLLYITKYLFL